MALVKRWVVMAHATCKHTSLPEGHMMMVCPDVTVPLPTHPVCIGVRPRKNIKPLNVAWERREDAVKAAKYYHNSNKNNEMWEYSVALVALESDERVM